MIDNMVAAPQMSPAPVPETVRQHFNHRIEEARLCVERLCVAKAKAEVLQLLDVPWNQLANIVYPESPPF